MERRLKRAQSFRRASPHSPFSRKKFEDDMWNEIGNYLDGKSLVMLASTCHWFCKLMMGDSFWKFAVLKDRQVPEPDDVAIKWIHLYSSVFKVFDLKTWDGKAKDSQTKAMITLNAVAVCTNLESNEAIWKAMMVEIDWTRIRSFFINSPVAFLMEKIVMPRKISHEDPEKTLPRDGQCILKNMKSGIWNADLQLVGSPVCELNTCHGTTQTLNMRHIELFLSEVYQDGCWAYVTVESYEIKKGDDSASPNIFYLTFIRNSSTAEVFDPKTWVGKAKDRQPKAMITLHIVAGCTDLQRGEVVKIGWTRVGSFLVNLPDTFLTEKIAMQRKILPEDQEKTLPRNGQCILKNMKSGMWIAVQLVRCPICDLNTCEGTMQTLDATRIELFLSKGYLQTTSAAIETIIPVDGDEKTNLPGWNTLVMLASYKKMSSENMEDQCPSVESPDATSQSIGPLSPHEGDTDVMVNQATPLVGNPSMEESEVESFARPDQFDVTIEQFSNYLPIPIDVGQLHFQQEAGTIWVTNPEGENQEMRYSLFPQEGVYILQGDWERFLLHFQVEIFDKIRFTRRENKYITSVVHEPEFLDENEVIFHFISQIDMGDTLVLHAYLIDGDYPWLELREGQILKVTTEQNIDFYLRMRYVEEADDLHLYDGWDTLRGDITAPAIVRFFRPTFATNGLHFIAKFYQV